MDPKYKAWTLEVLPILPDGEFKIKPKSGQSERVRTIKKGDHKGEKRIEVGSVEEYTPENAVKRGVELAEGQEAATAPMSF